jgi:hypothetical protein
LSAFHRPDTIDRQGVASSPCRQQTRQPTMVVSNRLNGLRQQRSA